ncbi:MAG: hypothetical protein WC476_04785 [Phycisphaerae bacterium]
MSEDNNGSRWLVISFLYSFCLLGMALCGVVGLLFFRGEQRIMEHPFWSKVLFVVGGGFLVLLLVVIPVQIFIFDRKERDSQSLAKLTIKDLIGLPFGVCNPNAKIPKWIKIPVLAILFSLLGILVIFVTMGLLAYLIHKVKGA